MPRPRAEQPTYSLTRRAGTRWWYVQWWEDGRAKRISCRTEDEGQAKRFLAEYKAGAAAEPVPASPTVGAILEGYMSHRARRPHSPTLQDECATLCRMLGDLPVDLLSHEQIDAYVQARRQAGAGGASAQYRTKVRPLSDGTLIRELGVLRTALQWAVGRQWIAAAPFIERPEAPPPRDRWLSEAEYQRLVDAAGTLHIRVFIVLALYTAARLGAILELTWDRVDFVAGQIDMGRGRGNKRRARVPMVPALREELARASEVAITPWVVEWAGAPVSSVKTGFRAAVTRAKLSGVTPHVLRHTAATWMVQRQVPLPMVAAYLGNSVQMVERVYGHHSPEWLRRAADALTGREVSSANGLDNKIADRRKA